MTHSLPSKPKCMHPSRSLGRLVPGSVLWAETPLAQLQNEGDGQEAWLCSSFSSLPLNLFSPKQNHGRGQWVGHVRWLCRVEGQLGAGLGPCTPDFLKGEACFPAEPARHRPPNRNQGSGWGFLLSPPRGPLVFPLWLPHCCDVGKGPLFLPLSGTGRAVDAAQEEHQGRDSVASGPEVSGIGEAWE